MCSPASLGPTDVLNSSQAYLSPSLVNLSLLGAGDWEAEGEGGDAEKAAFLHTRFVLYQVLTPIIFAFGIAGNVVSVVVLRRRRLRCTFDPEVESSAASGLVSLALSDAAFCLVGFLPALMPTEATLFIKAPTAWSVLALYYHTYRGALLNLFLLTSTWFTIAIAAARYLAVAHPFHAPRCAASGRQMAAVHAATFCVAVIVTVPQVFKYRVCHGYCEPGCYCYWREPGPLFSLGWYPVAWHAVGTILPLATLVYCNCRLLLQISHSLQPAPPRPKITVILAAIISLFLLLVCPSMALTFWSEVIGPGPSTNLYRFRTAVVVTNFTQSLNFAVNFVLYSTISKQFRLTLVAVLRCRRRGHAGAGSRSRVHLRMKAQQPRT